jgi:acyl-ACP thioesterase
MAVDRSLFSEMVAARPAGRVFEHEVRAGLADAAPGGRVRLDAIARWLQEAAYADVEDAGLGGVAAWVVRRTRLRVERFPRFDERLMVSTFCSGLGRMWAERRTTLSGPHGAVEAVALWIHLDPRTWRPVPLDDTELTLFREAAGERRIKARLRHPSPGEGAGATPWRFRATDLDLADHVNNAAYWAALEEDLAAGPEPAALDAEVEFRAPAQRGDAVVLHHDGALWITAPDGEVHASIVVGEL